MITQESITARLAELQDSRGRLVASVEEMNQNVLLHAGGIGELERLIGTEQDQAQTMTPVDSVHSESIQTWIGELACPE